MLDLALEYWQTTVGAPVPKTKCENAMEQYCGNVKQGQTNAVQDLGDLCVCHARTGAHEQRQVCTYGQGSVL